MVRGFALVIFLGGFLLLFGGVFGTVTRGETCQKRFLCFLNGLH